MWGAIATLFSALAITILCIAIITGAITFFYLGFKQLFGDDNEK